MGVFQDGFFQHQELEAGWHWFSAEEEAADAATGLAGHGHAVALQAVGTMRGYQGHGASPEGLESFAHPSKAASAGVWILTSSPGVPSAVQPSPSRG